MQYFDKQLNKMKTTESIVYAVLKDNLLARDDDFILYGGVLKRLGIDLKSTTLYDFLSTATRNKMPAFATVTKCRRTLQSVHQELYGKSASARQDLEPVYQTYNLIGGQD